MYTVIPRQGVVEHRPRPGEPALEIIDHREQQPSIGNSKKKRQEQLPYDTLKTQRDSLFKKELKYKKRIEDLEKDSADLLKTYENTYEENVKLKRILDSGPDAAKMKQLSKDKKEQKGIIDHLKDENQSLAEKIADLEKKVMAEKLKANDRSWNVQLAKVKKKREEEDAIPTEGPFVGGKVTKPKKLVLLDDDGPKELDAYDLQVDNLEKETQVLLNKVKILKREKEQIDYAMLMGKGAVTKNKTVAKAINDKLNRDLNKFVIRLQMLKMKQNAARTYCSLMTDESNPVIELKSTDVKSEQVTPDASARDSRSRRSWKRQLSDAPKSTNDISNPGRASKPQRSVQNPSGNSSKLSGRLINDKGKESVSKNPVSVTSRENGDKGNVAKNTTSSKSRSNKNSSDSKQLQSNKNASKDSTPKRLDSADIWERVQSSKLFGGTKPNQITGENSSNANLQANQKSSRDKNAKCHADSNTVPESTSQRKTRVLAPKPIEMETMKKKGECSKQVTVKDGHTPGSNDKKLSLKNNTGKSDDKKSKQIKNDDFSTLGNFNKIQQRNGKSGKQETDATGRYSHGPEPVGRKGLSDKKNAEHVTNVRDDAGVNTKSGVYRKFNTMPKKGLISGSFDDLTYQGQGHTYRINAPDDGFSLVHLKSHVSRTDRGVRAKPVSIHFTTKKSYDVKDHRSIIGNSGIRKDAFYRQLNDDDPYYGL